MKYRMIVLDLDGTLTNEKKEVTPRTFRALMKAQESGVKVVLASGRPTYGIVPLATQLRLKEFGGYILAYNGGRVIDCATGATVYNLPLCLWLCSGALHLLRPATASVSPGSPCL